MLDNYLLIDKRHLAGGVTVTTWPWIYTRVTTVMVGNNVKGDDK